MFPQGAFNILNLLEVQRFISKELDLIAYMTENRFMSKTETEAKSQSYFQNKKGVNSLNKISVEINDFDKKEFNNFIENFIHYQPIKRGNEWYQCNWSNLRISYFPNQRKIKIMNSLHKFFNSEILGIGLINHNDFKKSQVIESVNFLENAFNRPASEIKLIGRFEYGININTYSINPYDIIERYISSVTTSVNPFYAFYNKYGKPYSKFCSFTNYNIKAYNKSKEAGITDSNIFRFENSSP